MQSHVLIPNHLREERLAAGIESSERLAAMAGMDPAWYEHIEAGNVLPTRAELEQLTRALGDLPAERLYGLAFRVASGSHLTAYYGSGNTPTTMYHTLSDASHLLLAREELTWFEHQPGGAHQADVFLNLSCGTQRTPHLLLDTVAVLKRLGVSFVAAAGSGACCGSPFANTGRDDVAERIRTSQIARSSKWGARVRVNWCGSCQVQLTAAAARQQYGTGVQQPVRDVQVLGFLEERLRELGDEVPWRRSVPRRVLVEGHPDASPVHREAWLAASRLLAMVPGVEVVGLHDSGSVDDWRETGTPAAEQDVQPGTPEWPCKIMQATPASVAKHRAALSAYARKRGANTVSCQHQNCHLKWSRYTSEALAVRHAVSILAEALDCAHPDRFQAASRLGDPDAFVAQTRPIWQSWGIPEKRARELAASISDPTFAENTMDCSHGTGGCRTNTVGVDVQGTAAAPS